MIDHATPLADWVIVLPVLLCLLGAAVSTMLRGVLRVQMWVAFGVVALILILIVRARWRKREKTTGTDV